MKIYLASPYGFCESTGRFMKDVLIPLLTSQGHAVLNPWDLSHDMIISMTSVSMISDFARRSEAYRKINRQMGRQNEMAIRESDFMVAALDGQEVDSGVAAEVGFACGLGKKVIGYRGDFRLSGENVACQVNMQLQYFIEESGGKICSSLDELSKLLQKNQG